MKLPAAALCLTFAAATCAVAQPPEGIPQGGGPGGFMRFNPIFQALDSDEDGELSKGEIKNAAKALRKLDKNKDGQLTMDEVRPNFPQRGGPGERDDRRQPPAGNDPEDMVKNLMAFDQNGDGKLSKDELPDRMQGMLARGDANKDGFLTADEIRAMAASSPQGRGGPGGSGGGPRRMDPLFAALDLNHDGTLSKDEIDAAPDSLKALDKNSDGKLTMDELRPGRPPQEQQ